MIDKPLTKTSYFISIATLIAVVAGFFVPRLMAYLPGLLGLIFTITLFWQQRTLVKPNKIDGLFFAGLIILASLSSLWSINPAFSLERSMKLASIILPTLFLLTILKRQNTLAQPFFIKGIIACHIFASAFLIFEQLSGRIMSAMIVDYEVTGFHLNRSFVVYAFLSLMTLMIISVQDFKNTKTKYIIFGALALLSLGTLSLSGSQTAQLSFLCGLLFFLFFPIRSLIITKTFWGIILLLCLALPFIMKPMMTLIPEEALLSGVLLEASIVHRFEVWDFTITEIQKNPLYGHGIEAQRFMTADKWMVHQQSDNVLHAHNLILQIWIEFGVIGIALFMAFLGYLYKNISSVAGDQTRKIYITLFATIFCCAMTGYGIWQSWQVGLFLFFTATTLGITQRKPT